MSEVVPFTPLNMINKERSGWKVRVKVIDEWKKTWFGKPDSILSYEFILVDFEGNKIRAMIYKNLMPFFAHSFKEGAFVDLSNFEVKLHDDEYKLVHHEFKISLVKKSVVKRCQPFNILRDIYNFVDFKDVQESIVSKDDVFDVVGQLVKLTKMKVDKETEADKKSIDFELADARLASARDNADYVKPVIEIDIGKEETSALDKYTDQKKYPAYVLDDVRHIEDVCTFVVRGWIHSFNDNEGWFQYYCSMCEENRVIKVYDVEEMKYVYDCRVCKWTGDDPIKKIRASMYIQDKTGGCELALFDGQISKMIHRSVPWLKNTARTTSDPSEFPVELNRVIMKKFAFMVKHNVYGEDLKQSGYTVSDMTDNTSVLNKLDAILAPKEVEYDDFDESIDTKSPDTQKVSNVDVISNCETPSSTSKTPGSNGVKCKIPSPSGSAEDDTPTGGTTSALGDLKIPKMETL
ncbi:uncharacterized protein [Rutidosis leptorrhynchoides]|uniref:uncharacterized protein n=1 Tax=Rutidosis leptorrhynchoides TaxID=125765 RepID=UPI003A995B68